MLARPDVWTILTLLPPWLKFEMLKSAMAGSPSLGVAGAVAGECFIVSSAVSL